MALGWLLCLALASWAVARLALGYPPADRALPWLSSREQAFLHAAADAVFPPGGELPPSGSEAGVLRHVDRYVASVSARSRVLIRLLFFLLEHATLVFPAPGWDGFRRFSALSELQRTAVLDAWGRSPRVLRRTVFQSLRAILTMAYFSSPRVLRAIGLAPLAFETPVVDADLLYPAIGRSRASIRFGVADRERSVTRTPLDPHGPLHPDYAEEAPR